MDGNVLVLFVDACGKSSWTRVGAPLLYLQHRSVPKQIFLGAAAGSSYIVFALTFYCMASCPTSGGIYFGLYICWYVGLYRM